MSEDRRTRREGGGTRREDGPPHDGATRREGAGSGFVRVVLPSALGSRFVVVGELASSGAEADVVLAEEVSSARQVVVKLYRRGVAPDETAVGRLAEASQPGGLGWDHVVEVIDWGREEGCWFEVLEFCGRGSLRSLMVDGPRPELAEVVRELAAALSFAHGLGLVHRDLKPENVLVRSVLPLDLVLGDFGLARAVDASVRWTRAWGTPSYSPPELAGGEVSSAWDWWSLGMIVAEMAGGRHPFELVDGTMMADQQIQSSLAQRPVDLSAVTDPRLGLLCRGLLTRDRGSRWGADKVGEWLAGRSPSVVADNYVVPGTRVRSVLFGGVEHSSPVELAAAFQQNWNEAFRRLFQERDRDLVDELERLLRHQQLDEAVRVLASQSVSAAELPRRFADLLAEMDPELEALYKGTALTRAGLEETALNVVRAGGDNPSAATLDEVRRQNILTRWRRLPDMAHGPATQDAWVTANDELEAAVKGLNADGYKPDTNDWAIARAWLLLCVLDPDHHTSQLAGLVEDLDPTHADQRPWWHTLRTASEKTPAVLVLTLLAHPAATEQTHKQAEQARRDQHAAAERQRAEEQRRRADRRAARAGANKRVGWIVVAIIAGAGPFGVMAWAIHAGHAAIFGIPCFISLVYACPVAFAKAFKRRRS